MTAAPLTAGDFRDQMDLLAVAGRLVLEIDVDALLDHVTTADTLAAVFEPTAYVRGGADNLRDQATFLRGAAAFRKACESLRPTAEAAT